jgi:hypothetical protein
MYDFSNFALKTQQSLYLLLNVTGKRIERDFLDLSEEVLDTNFFRFVGFDSGFDVEK